uniref:Putative LysE family transporter n=1 Tax=Magnetococcus massalia (strain MO-1) TaxID=451514 RepID=A0A1S7LE55_MAGMO|nr:Putative LysE family transporter [Candidatus Magnetococcus massalia]
MTSLLIIISPGQDMVLVISRSIASGAKAGMMVALGISVGLLGHTLLAVLGLGALLQASEFAFTAMKMVGAGYLLYMGIQTLRSPPVVFAAEKPAPARMRSLFMLGAFANLSNPKIAIFYLAYLPQFVSVESGAATWMLLILGVAFALLTALVKIPVGYLAGTLSRWFQENPKAQTWLHRISGGVLIGLAAKLATEGPR